MHDILNIIKYDSDGLVPVIVQDEATKKVLMMAYANKDALEKMEETGETWFYSRSRKKLWHKGEESGNIQKIKKVLIDCDNDTLLILVEPKGPACHTGNKTCFYREK